MPDNLPFTKMQGIGNDFVVIDARGVSGLDWSALAPELCDRHTGIGADGLLVLDATQLADIMMWMYNPDGTPDVCGNGLRCLARYAIDRKVVAADTLRIATLGGVRSATALRSRQKSIYSVSVVMGAPRFDPPSIPIRLPTSEVIDYTLDLGHRRSLKITALSTGSTHAVTFVDQLPGDDVFYSVSPLVERHALFPERTSLMWCRVENANQISLRVWERGVGETLGCGTGASAAAVAAVRHGYVTSGVPISVVSKGGELLVTWSEGSEVVMSGPAEYVFEGVYQLEGKSA
jgi:diaminopimelate epimerase